MKLVIIAGGKGTRLGLQDIPKPMVPVCGKPLLEHHVRLAAASGMEEVLILSGHLSHVIRDHFGNGENFGIPITHIEESTPLGTAGSINQLKNSIDERFMVLYGDIYADFAMERMIAYDSREDSLATLLVHPNDHPYDSDLVEVDRNGRVTAFLPKPHPEGLIYRNLVNAAVYILSPDIFSFIPTVGASDFGRDVFPMAVNHPAGFRAYQTSEYIKDIGTPDRLAKVEGALETGLPPMLNMKNRQKAIFLDRDGVLNEEIGDLSSPGDFRLLPGAAEAVARINGSGYLAVVVTNQPAVAKGFMSRETLDSIHKTMETQLGERGAYLDAIYYCPHHPEKGFKGEVPELKRPCNCRKPAPGMLQQAAKAMNIDLSQSYIIGDRHVDVAAGKQCGTRTVLVKTGFGGSDGQNGFHKPDHIANNILQATEYIL